MGPMERIFRQLNSELESTIHLCYPFVKVDNLFWVVYISIYLLQDMLESLKPRVEDETDSAHLFASELQDHFKSQFGFLLSKEDRDFQPLFWLATYLSPVYRVALSTVEIEEAKKFAKSKLK